MLRRHGELEAVTWTRRWPRRGEFDADRLPVPDSFSSQLSLEDLYIARSSAGSIGAEPVLDSRPLVAPGLPERSPGKRSLRPLNFELGALSQARSS